MSSYKTTLSSTTESTNKPSMIEPSREERSVDKPSLVKPPKK
ncbi:hypothetical protein J2Z32_003726 [Paenibacillus turicensis]|uniref:Uncharacterized protein n=1 Tax=Paenibacillus turicensis TaxID=160487 RepID=A0ABS4FWV1_9BACL|nr:hypothetical protein [Paenibacillus turicensis]MBP1907061.1 hypothetical protein [Paenibacillus turicensis]